MAGVWMTTYELFGINPMPWTPGTIATHGKRRWMVKDTQLVVYQEAVKEAMLEGYPDLPLLLDHDGPLSVTFALWRELERSEDAEGKKHRAKIADATNLQKALEDALQGVLYGNDQHNLHVQTYLMEQSELARPRIVIMVKPFEVPDWIEVT